jgi:heme-degrading monooxygenase HmoA
MYAVIAIHYPKPEHIENFLAFMAKVETVAHDSPGMLRFGSWREDGGKRLVGLSMWESKGAFEASLPQITSLHEERSAEWSDRPDDVLFLAEP